MKKIATFVPIAVSILILTVVSIPLIMGAVENIYTYLAGSAGLIASWIGLYSSVIRPVLRKPEVSLEPITSTVVFEPEEGLKTYLRLKVTNIGLTAAKNCVGRILELRDEDNTQISYDPLYFFWARQNDENVKDHPVTIYSGDSEYLDIARIAQKDMNFKLRVSSMGQPLPGGKYMPIKQYFIKLAIYADEMSPFQAWYRVNVNTSFLKDAYLQVMKEPDKKN